MFLRNTKNTALELEKQSLTIELSEMRSDLLLQMGINDSLNEVVQKEAQKLSALIDSVNFINAKSKKTLSIYQSKIAVLRSQNNRMIVQLDSANEAYTALKLREQMVSDSLERAMNTNEELASDNNNLRGANRGLSDKLRKGQQLVISSSVVQPMRFASNGKDRKTRRAKRTDQLEVCIDIAANKIAEIGEVTLYAKWLDSKGKLVAGPEDNVAMVGGEYSNYNGETGFVFDGENVNVCILAKRSINSMIELSPGIYTIAVMTDSYLVGTVAVELK